MNGNQHPRGTQPMGSGTPHGHAPQPGHGQGPMPGAPGSGRDNELMGGSNTVFEFTGSAADGGNRPGTFVGSTLDLSSPSEQRENNLRSGSSTWLFMGVALLLIGGAVAFVLLGSDDSGEAESNVVIVAADETPAEPVDDNAASGGDASGGSGGSGGGASDGSGAATAGESGATPAGTTGGAAAPGAAEDPKAEPTAEDPKAEPTTDEPKPEPKTDEPKTEPTKDEPKPASDKPKPSTDKPKPKPSSKPSSSKKKKKKTKRLSSKKPPRDPLSNLPKPPG